MLDYDAYVDTGVNWRIKEGNGAAIAAVAASIVPRFECAVTAIDHRHVPVRLETQQGPVSARAVIVTVPTSLLAKERIAFSPPLPDKAEAAAGLRLGTAEKAFFLLAQPEEFPVEGHLFGRIDQTATVPIIHAAFRPSLCRSLYRRAQCRGFDPRRRRRTQRFRAR